VSLAFKIFSWIFLKDFFVDFLWIPTVFFLMLYSHEHRWKAASFFARSTRPGEQRTHTLWTGEDGPLSWKKVLMELDGTGWN